jgi:hypothetical protein
MPAIAEIDGFGLRPHIAISSRSSFNEKPHAVECQGAGGIYLRLFRAPSSVPVLCALPTRRASSGLPDCCSLNSMQKEQECQTTHENTKWKSALPFIGRPTPAPRECYSWEQSYPWPLGKRAALSRPASRPRHVAKRTASIKPRQASLDRAEDEEPGKGKDIERRRIRVIHARSHQEAKEASDAQYRHR